MQEGERKISVSKDAEIIELGSRVKKEFNGSSWKGRKKVAEWNKQSDRNFAQKEAATNRENGKATESMRREKYERAVAWAKENNPGQLESVKREFLKDRPDAKKFM